MSDDLFICELQHYLDKSEKILKRILEEPNNEKNKFIMLLKKEVSKYNTDKKEGQ